MSVLPRGEKLRRAVRWISDRLREDPERALGPLLSDASLRFNLSPAEAEYLLSFYRKGRAEAGDP